jgi:lipocalin
MMSWSEGEEIQGKMRGLLRVQELAVLSSQRDRHPSSRAIDYASGGDCWIIDPGREYEYAVAGTPYRRYLWILRGTTEMQPDMLEEIKSRALFTTTCYSAKGRICHEHYLLGETLSTHHSSVFFH